jgi:hypothetical protein
MAEMMCVAMDPEEFKDNELPSDEFEDLSEPEYKLLTQDEASDDKEDEKDSSEEDVELTLERALSMGFTKQDWEEQMEYYKKVPRKERDARQ